MSYVDAIHNRDLSKIQVVERVNGERVYKEYPGNYTFYYTDPKGKHRTIYDTYASKATVRTWKEFQKEIRMFPKENIWESDINPIFKCLAENYIGVLPPKLQTAFYDIETSFDATIGYSSADDALNAITAISIYLNWTNQCITLAIKPPAISQQSADDIASKFENCFLFTEEKDMLDMFLNVIYDADIISGWNSEGYDIPYTVNRVKRILGNNDAKRFCLWNKDPAKRTFERYGAEQNTYDLIGRIHLDYMQLYRKYTFHEMHSYSLDAISEYELDDHKVAYSGTLEELYNNDFEKFIAYNRQDTELLYRLDSKLKFIELASAIAHENTVLIPTTAGVVAVTEQAIINEAHSRELIVPNRVANNPFESEADPEILYNEDQAAGAYVATPKIGMHKWVGVMDINSLYPSTIRALNMGPETVVGQLRQDATISYIQNKMKNKMSFAEAWDGLFGSLEYQSVMKKELGCEIIIDWENGKSESYSATDVWNLIFNSNKKLCLSANGTIFSYDKKGIIPGLLERWYAERKVFQAKKKAVSELIAGITIPTDMLLQMLPYISETNLVKE